MRWAVAMAVVVCAWLAHGHGAAQAGAEASPEELEQARALFVEALELADRGDWERAVHRFRSALELRDAPTIRYNLAISLGRLNQVVEALAELDRVDASAETTEALAAQAVRLRGELEPRLARLRVDVAGDGVGTHVTVDGAPWAHVGAFAPSNPGVLAVRLWRGDDELDQEEVDVPDGGRARVELRVPLRAPAASPASEVLAGPDGADGGDAGDDGLLIGLGVGAAILAVAAAVLVTVLVVDGQGGAAPTMGDFGPPLLRIDG